MMKYLSRFLPLLLVLFLLQSVACHRRGKDVLSEKEMVNLLADIAIAQAYKESGNPANLPDSVRTNINARILASHGYTQAQMDSTLAWYGRNLDKYYLLFDKVDKEIAHRQKKIEGTTPIAIKEDNLWPYSQFAWFSKQSPSQGLTFSFPSEALERGESLRWKMRFNNSANLKVMFGVDYADNTSSIVTSSTYGQRELDVELLTDTAKKVNRIYGSLYIPMENMPLWADSIQIIKSPFDSLQYYKYQNQRFIRR